MMHQEAAERWVASGDLKALEAAVLLFAVDNALTSGSPRITTREVAVVIGGEEEAENIQDAVEEVAKNLASHRLIHSGPRNQHRMVEPTRAALRYTELLDR